MPRKKRKSHRKAIVRALVQRQRTKAGLITYLGAQDAWDAVDYDLQQLRKQGFIESSWHFLTDGKKYRVWRLSREGILHASEA